VVAAVVLVVAVIAIGLFVSRDDDSSPTAAVDTTAAPTSEAGASDSSPAEAPADTVALDPGSEAEIEPAREELATFFDQLPPEDLESLCLAWEADPDGITEVWATAYQAIVEQEEGSPSTLSEEELSEATATVLDDVCA
jgi:hypothetical protein